MTASGLVPREIVPGIEWGEEAEREYLGILETMKVRMPEATAAQEAKWAVEAALCRRHIRDEVGRANRCGSVSEKKNLYTRWIKLFGEKRAKALARMVKDEKGNKAAMSW